jgi:endoglucanase Acf2
LGENLGESNSDSYKVEELAAEASIKIRVSILESILECRYLISASLDAVEQMMFVLVRIARDKKVAREDIDALARARENIYINARNVDRRLNDLIKTLGGCDVGLC